MAEQLRGNEGVFILSINDRPEIREIFVGFAIEEAKVRYSVSRGAVESTAAELIASNKQNQSTFI